MTASAVQATRVRAGATSFAELTTFGLGGTFDSLVEASTESEVIDALRAAKAAGHPVAVIGGGSNILASDDHFPGVVIRDCRSSIELLSEAADSGVQLRVTAGTAWDCFVAYCVKNSWVGVEAMSGIPGTVGAAPVQNIGAYGQEVAGVIESVRAYDRSSDEIVTLRSEQMRFGYRTSAIKETIAQGWRYTPRYVVLSVDFRLASDGLAAPVRYGQLAASLGVETGARVPATDVREAVLRLRRSKGMVLDDTDRDTYSAGSFFTNPIIDNVTAASLPDDAPRHGVASTVIGDAAPKQDGQIKTSAAWLIDHAGFPAGYGMPGPAALSTKHCLALTNRGGASGADVRHLMRTIQAGVAEQFGVVLVPEPVIY